MWFELPRVEGWRPSALPEDGHVKWLAERPQARGLDVSYAGPHLLTVVEADRIARLALHQRETGLWWHWLQRPNDTGVPPMLEPICPADEVRDLVDVIAAAMAAS